MIQVRSGSRNLKREGKVRFQADLSTITWETISKQ